MVVVATPNYDPSDLPAIVRIRQAQGNQLQIKVQNPSDTPLTDYDIHLVVLEEGTYTEAEHGVNLEAYRFNSTQTDGATLGWNGQPITPQNTYQNPVVFGSVMTDNNPNWVSFWNDNLSLGKHIGEDPNTTRLDETLGYVIIESGTGTINGQKFIAQLGSDSIEGVDNGGINQYSLPTLDFTPQTAILSQNGMDGANGGWAFLAGDNPVNSSNLNLLIDEDQVLDNERKHTDEQVAYLLFESPNQSPNFAPTINPQTFNNLPENSANNTLVGTIIASDPDGDTLTYQITQNIDIDNDGNNAFRLEGNQLIVNDSDDLDYETNPTLPITIQVSDGQLTSEALVTINLLNINEQTPISIGEFGQISLSSDTQTIQLQGNYVNPVVFVLTPSFNESDAVSPRLTEVTNHQFTVSLEETSYLLGNQNSDTSHIAETISYLVLEEGNYTLSNGAQLEVGEISVNGNLIKQNKEANWHDVTFHDTFDLNPVVLSQIQTNNEEGYLVSRQRNLTPTGVQLGLQKEEFFSNSLPLNETIGYLALSQGDGLWNSHAYTAGLTGNVVDDQWFTESFTDLGQTPQLFASFATTNGYDPLSLRYQNLESDSVQFLGHEEQSLDSELRHTNEDVNYLAIVGNGVLTGLLG
jgi:hypothetical protein